MKISESIDILLKTKKEIFLNANFVKQYLFFRYDDIYGKEDTFYSNIKFLKASHCKKFNFETLQEQEFCYWDFSKLKLDKKIKFKNAVNQLDKEILSSFQKLKFKKKETIVAVSGGMDSTSSSYYLKKLNYNLPSFTVKYDVSTNLNEFDRAKQVASEFCKSWKLLNIDYKMFIDYWKKCYNYHSQPLATSSCLGYDLIFHKIKKLGFDNIINSGSSDDLFGSNFPGFMYNLIDYNFSKKKKFNKELKYWIKYYSTKEYPKNFETIKNLKKITFIISLLFALNHKFLKQVI